MEKVGWLYALYSYTSAKASGASFKEQSTYNENTNISQIATKVLVMVKITRLNHHTIDFKVTTGSHLVTELTTVPLLSSTTPMCIHIISTSAAGQLVVQSLNKISWTTFLKS